MSDLPSLHARWRETLRANRDRVALVDCDSSSSVTFDELEHMASAFERKLTGEAPRKLAPGDRVVIQMKNGAGFLAQCLALWRLGLVIVPVDRTLGRPEAQTIAEFMGATLLLNEDTWTDVHRDTEHPAASPPGTVMVKLTSGSTGTPKGIALSDSQLLADAANICSTMDIRPADLNFAAIPLSHSYGFDNLVLPLITQGTPVAVLGEVLPRAVLEGIASSKATVFPAVPFLLDALGRLPEPVPRLDSLRTVISAGAPLSASVYHAFRKRFGIGVHQFYGSSECGGITYEREPKDDFVEGCVGTPMNNVSVGLGVDDRVQVRGANVATGYFPAPGRDDEPVLGHGVFLTGDIGRIDETGRVHLLGRVSSFINVAGRKVDPVEIEKCLVQFPGVSAATVMGVADATRGQAIAAFVTRQRTGFAVDALLQHCREHLAPWKVPRVVKVLDALPMNSRGKLDREQLQKLL